MKKFQNQKGLSLIEVTIMLLVLMLLTGVLAPSIMDFVNDAKWVKVKEDCEAISLSIARLTRDVGCVVTRASNSLADQKTNCQHRGIDGYIPSVLRGDGRNEITVAAALAGSGLEDYTPAIDLNWNAPVYGSLAGQLISNTPQYVQPPLGAAFPVGPQFNIGWRGAYLSPSIGPDPWGSPYLVNSAFLNVATGGVRHNYDTFCISAGPNTVFETKFQQENATTGVGSDDFITIISGGFY